MTATRAAAALARPGAWLDEAMLGRLAGRLLAEAKIAPVLAGVHADIEVNERSGDGRRMLILINHGDKAHPVQLPAGSRRIAGSLDGDRLPAHGVAVIRLP